jgi:hypothetical protein
MQNYFHYQKLQDNLFLFFYNQPTIFSDLKYISNLSELLRRYETDHVIGEMRERKRKEEKQEQKKRGHTEKDLFIVVFMNEDGENSRLKSIEYNTQAYFLHMQV